MNKISIKDVAEHAGVSLTTVSRVLNNRGYISGDMRDKVNSSIRELGFIPNEIARSFYTNSTKQIGLIVSSIANPYFSELAFHVEKSLFNRGYKMLLCNSVNEKNHGKDYLRMLQENRVDGVICCSHHIDIDDYKLLPLKMISIERFISDDISIVQVDNYAGGKLATEALIFAGCKKILCINGERNPREGEPAYDRLLAYLDSVKEYGLESFVEKVQFAIGNPHKHEQISRILSQNNYDGVFAGDDVTASLVYDHAQKLGINVPEQMKIIGFDGTTLVRDVFPALATIQQPIGELAETAVKMLIDLINDIPVPKRTILPVKLIKGRTLGGE